MTNGGFPPGCVLIFGRVPGAGDAVAKCFAKAGSALALSHTHAPSLEEWRGIQDLGLKATFHCMDVRVSGEAEAMVDQVIAAHERVHTVVWAVNDMAGERHAQPGLEVDWGQQLYSHTQGISRVVAAIRPHFRTAGGGSFVLLLAQDSSGKGGATGLAAALKAASETMIQSIVDAEGCFGVRANSVVLDLPSGTFGSGLGTGCAVAADTAETWDSGRRPVARALLEEAGHSAVFLASREAARVTGQQIRLSAWDRSGGL